MNSKILNTIGKFGIGLAIAGGVANSALYNGDVLFLPTYCSLLLCFNFSLDLWKE